MSQHFLLLFLSVFISTVASAQVGINTLSPDPSAALDVTSNTNNKGFLPPRMTTAERNAITTPAEGLIIYNTSTECLNFYDGKGWKASCGTILYGIIGILNCGAATNNGTLIAGVEASGVSFTVPYDYGNNLPHDGQIVTSTGVTGLTATLASGTLWEYGNLDYIITGIPSSIGTATFALNIGGQMCTKNFSVFDILLNCAGAINSGTLTQGLAASSVSIAVPYTVGSGLSHSGQTVTSTGVTGLTATLAAGSYASGAGNLTYNISGTPESSGIASFQLNIGEQQCTRFISVGCGTVTFTYNGSSVTYGTVGGANNTCWLDRNLGANRVAVSPTDAESYGHLFQWGRRADGHQRVNRYTGDPVTTSSTTSVLATTDTPAHGNFIIANGGGNNWRSPHNDNLWQGVSGVNNPCPSGYRLPTETELNNERLSWLQPPINSTNYVAGAFASPLKLPMAGGRYHVTGSISNAGTSGYYSSSTVSGGSNRFLFINGNDNTASISSTFRATGSSVRCIKN